jgi:hypothetical protein
MPLRGFGRGLQMVRLQAMRSCCQPVQQWLVQVEDVHRQAFGYRLAHTGHMRPRIGTGQHRLYRHTGNRATCLGQHTFGVMRRDRRFQHQHAVVLLDQGRIPRTGVQLDARCQLDAVLVAEFTVPALRLRALRRHCRIHRKGLVVQCGVEAGVEDLHGLPQHAIALLDAVGRQHHAVQQFPVVVVDALFHITPGEPEILERRRAFERIRQMIEGIEQYAHRLPVPAEFQHAMRCGAQPFAAGVMQVRCGRRGKQQSFRPQRQGDASVVQVG